LSSRSVHVIEPGALDLLDHSLGGIMLASYKKSLSAAFVSIVYLAIVLPSSAQSNSTTVGGTVSDPSGAVVANAVVRMQNPVSRFDRSTSTDDSGKFSFPNVPFNPYHLSVSDSGFAPYAQDVDVRSVLALDIKISLKVSGSSESITVEAGGDLVENDPTGHSDVDRGLFDKFPLKVNRHQ
jgi:Carboxypeptidase regulatory-like domain